MSKAKFTEAELAALPPSVRAMLTGNSQTKSVDDEPPVESSAQADDLLTDIESSEVSIVDASSTGDDLDALFKTEDLDLPGESAITETTIDDIDDLINTLPEQGAKPEIAADELVDFSVEEATDDATVTVADIEDELLSIEDELPEQLPAATESVELETDSNDSIDIFEHAMNQMAAEMGVDSPVSKADEQAKPLQFETAEIEEVDELEGYDLSEPAKPITPAAPVTPVTPVAPVVQAPVRPSIELPAATRFESAVEPVKASVKNDEELDVASVIASAKVVAEEVQHHKQEAPKSKAETATPALDSLLNKANEEAAAKNEPKQNNKLQQFAIVGLLIIAIVGGLGYKIYKKRAAKNPIVEQVATSDVLLPEAKPEPVLPGVENTPVVNEATLPGLEVQSVPQTDSTQAIGLPPVVEPTQVAPQPVVNSELETLKQEFAAIKEQVAVIEQERDQLKKEKEEREAKEKAAKEARAKAAKVAKQKTETKPKTEGESVPVIKAPVGDNGGSKDVVVGKVEPMTPLVTRPSEVDTYHYLGSFVSKAGTLGAHVEIGGQVIQVSVGDVIKGRFTVEKVAQNSVTIAGRELLP